MADRKYITVMIGDTPLCDASIAPSGDVFVEQTYQQPAERPVRYERVQFAELERRVEVYYDQTGNGRDMAAVKS